MSERIVLVGPVPPPTGGIAAHVAALARGLGSIGVAATVVDPRSRLRLVGAVGRAGLAGDLVHLHVCGHNAKSYGLLAACLAATPMRPALVTLHSGLLPRFLDELGATARRTIAELLGRASAVIAVSPDVAAAVAALGIARPDVVSPFVARTLRPGRPPAHVAAAAGAPLLAAAVAPGREYGASLLVAGFAQLAAQLSGAILAVFGPGGADAEVARRLGERGLGDRVIALGELDPRAALGTLVACDAFLRPTLADGDAVSVREARALGCRVVASDVARRPPGTTLFPAGDLDGFVAAMKLALVRPAPAAVADDGFAGVVDIYTRLGSKEVSACAASPGA